MNEKKKDFQKIIQEMPERESKPDEKEVELDLSIPINKAYKYLKSRFEFRFNVITEEVEYRKKGSKEKFRFIDNKNYKRIYGELRRIGIKIIDAELDSIIGAPDDDLYIGERFNPFTDYLYKLPEWKEGDPDYIQQFLLQINLVNEENRIYFVEFFKKWLVGMIVALLEDEFDPFFVNQLAFVMVGAQGRYKSTFLKRLLPPEWRTKYYYESSFVFGNKDSELLLGTKVLINLDELSSMNKTDIDKVKQIITQAEVEVRPAYAREKIKYKRRASFCGSINRKEFLRDETGNRRWFVVEVSKINIPEEEFDLAKIYSQALYYKQNGFKYWADQEDIQTIDSKNTEFVSESMEEQLVLSKFKIPEKEDFENNQVLYLTPTEIANILSVDNQKLNINNSVVQNIGKALLKNGFNKKGRRTDHKNVRYFYEVVRMFQQTNAPLETENKIDVDLI